MFCRQRSLKFKNDRIKTKLLIKYWKEWQGIYDFWMLWLNFWIKITDDFILRNRDTGLSLAVQILPSPAGSEDLLLNDFSTHLTLIIPLLKKLREEMRKSPHVVGLWNAFSSSFRKNPFSEQKQDTFEWACVRGKARLLWLFRAVSMRRTVISDSVKSVKKMRKDKCFVLMVCICVQNGSILI